MNNGIAVGAVNWQQHQWHLFLYSSLKLFTLLLSFFMEWLLKSNQKFIQQKLFGVLNDRGMDPFTDPCEIFGAPWRSIWILKLVQCKQASPAPIGLFYNFFSNFVVHKFCTPLYCVIQRSWTKSNRCMAYISYCQNPTCPNTTSSSHAIGIDKNIPFHHPTPHIPFHPPILKIFLSLRQLSSNFLS